MGLGMSLGLCIELLSLHLRIRQGFTVHPGLILQGLHLSLGFQALCSYLQALRLHMCTGLGWLRGFSVAVGGHKVCVVLRARTGWIGAINREG